MKTKLETLMEKEEKVCRPESRHRGIAVEESKSSKKQQSKKMMGKTPFMAQKPVERVFTSVTYISEHITNISGWFMS